MKAKTKAKLKELAAWFALVALISIAGHFSYEDAVLQGQSNCDHPAYAFDNPQYCEGK